MSSFFAYLSRMKLIRRWGLMRNTQPENIQEHSLQVAVVAHALALLRNAYHGGDVDAERVMALAAFHEAAEVFTGDLPTPIKYFNKEMKKTYDDIERQAKEKLCAMLPEPLRESYRSLLFAEPQEAELWQLVKAADKLCAWLKCVEEDKAGNAEFRKAEKSIRAELEALPLPEVRTFLELFGESFALSLDEMG